MDFRNRHVVITGGAGALGAAVVGALVEAGAICHVPCHDEAEAQRFPLRENRQVVLTVTGSLADDEAVGRFYQAVTPLWASIHLAGGFAAGPLRDAAPATLRQQIDMNLVTCLLCCRAAVGAMMRGGARRRRPHRQCRRPPGPGMAQRRRHGRLCREQGGGRRAYRRARRRSRQGRHPGQCGRAFDHGYARQPRAMPKADYGLWPKVEEVAATILFLASPDNRVTRGAIVPVYGKSEAAAVPPGRELAGCDALRDQKRGGRGVRAGPPLPGAPATGRGFIGNRPSRCNFLRASLRARRMASAFSRTLRSDGFS